MGVKRKIKKEKKELRKRTVRKIREQGGTSCRLFWTDVRGKKKERRLNRMKDEEGRIVEGEDDMLARHWEELGRRSRDCSEDDVVLDTAIGDVGGCGLGMCKEVCWEEVVEVLKCLRRGKPPGHYQTLIEMVMYGGGRLVEMMLHVMNLVLRSESCLADWYGVC